MGVAVWDGKSGNVEKVKRLKRDPLAYAAIYTLDLYCDHENPEHPWDSFPHSFLGETFGRCARDARRAGWIIHKDRTATCPVCNRKR